MKNFIFLCREIWIFFFWKMSELLSKGCIIYAQKKNYKFSLKSRSSCLEVICKNDVCKTFQN